MSAPLIAADEPIRVVLVGAGNMGKNWLRVLTASTDVVLVGLVDLDTKLAADALLEFGLTDVSVGSDVVEVATASAAQAVINVTVPVAHNPVNTGALFAGLPVLCEKPIAPTVSQALSIAATAEVAGQLLMTSQSRRYFRTLSEYRAVVAQLGAPGIVTTEFYKAPRFGGFRDEMANVLLIDMAIHAFDAVRFILGQDPVAVYCEEFNPAWSWYAGDAGATAIFELSGGTRYIYTGSWCSDGLETSWNGRWRVSAADGSALWDGEHSPVAERNDGSAVAADGSSFANDPEEIAGSLAEFVRSLRTGVVPSTEVHSNVLSLAMVEAAVRSSERKARVTIAEVLADALGDAIEHERNPDIRGALERMR
ncbi:Gfo/Idh/MocA family protein [Lysinibacter cavernae]|uniref:Putative dehydrogenase n=1 Tax=Lysinibacter cavernae TaxID=1640652 RepID=A0A7X5R3J8_9MICO|nr:Gfo/Idh/MocA family oxidoreductase [Lysinibacter cavernae]NIH54882.1 putative dehydrogenase [Lysinibacter cavernae]